jgi:hypothetical protein
VRKQASTRTFFGIVCLCVLGLAALAGSSAPTVSAAESFPGQGFLPDNRAWEMVSPPDKHGGSIAAMTPRIHAAADGDAAAFASAIGFGDVQGTDATVEYISQRDGRPGTNGWSTHAITPRLPSLTFFVAGQDDLSTYRGDFSADLSHAVFRSARPLTDAPNVTDVANLYLRDDLRSPGPGNYELLTDAASPLGFEGFPLVFLVGATRPWLVGASSDFSHVAFESPLGLTPDTSSSLSEFRLFENDEGSVRLVGRVPKEPDETFCDDAGGPSVECVSAPTSQAGISASLTTYSSRMVSADGSRILFQTPTGAAGNIYMREDSTRTFQLNASEKEPPEPPAGDARIWDASRDGSRIFFTTAQSLVEADEDAFFDLYMYEVEKPEGERLTLIGNNGNSVIGASDDGHYLYFTAGVDLHLWHDGDISDIGDVNALRNSPRTSWDFGDALKRSRVSPDGRHLLFMTAHAGNEEFYVYDADSDRLRCASCNPSGAPATSSPRLDMFIQDQFIQSSEHLSHALSDDGRYAFFSTPERLVPSDTNGTWDAYLYDTETEEVRLLSSGEDQSASYFADASADGKDALILTSEKLSRWDNDTSYDLYDARVDGGLPEPLPLPPSCQGDACQPTPTQLNDPTPASSSFKGAHNPTSARCPRGKRKVKARNGKSRCVKRHAKKQHKRTAKHNRRAGR